MSDKRGEEEKELSGAPCVLDLGNLFFGAWVVLWGGRANNIFKPFLDALAKRYPKLFPKQKIRVLGTRRGCSDWARSNPHLPDGFEISRKIEDEFRDWFIKGEWKKSKDIGSS